MLWANSDIVSFTRYRQDYDGDIFTDDSDSLPSVRNSRTDLLQLPRLPANNPPLEVNGTKPKEIKSIYGPQVSLPHISQKSRRPIPQLHQKHKPGSLSTSLETLEIYKKTKLSKTPRQQSDREEGRGLPCPSPAQSPRVTPVHDHNPTVVASSTTTSKPRGKKKKKTSKQDKRDTKNVVSVQNSSVIHTVSPVLPAISTAGQHPVTVPKMSLQRKSRSTNLPPPEGSLNILSYQLLEIPGYEYRKPSQKYSYDEYQHSKFSKEKQLNKRLSIVEGPESKVEMVWDYNRFLYLNVKL